MHPSKARYLLAAMAAIAMAAGSIHTAAADSSRRPLPKQLAACPSAKTVTILEGQNGATVPVTFNDTVIVRLPVQSGTGFSWTLKPQSGAALATAGVIAPDGAARPGGPAVEIFRLQAAAQGRQTLSFDYRRPWERDKPPARTFSVTIEVGGC